MILRCCHCKEDKEEGSFHKNKSRKTGWAAQCIDCTKQWLQENRGKSRVMRSNNYYKNREKILLKRKELYDPEKQKAYYLSRAEEISLRGRIYKETHKKELKAKQKEREKNNPEYYKIINLRKTNKRRALRYKTKGRVTTADINKLIEDSNNICFWCDKEIKKMHLDHVYPLSRGGEDTINNLVVSCSVCNQHKSDKMPEDWLDQIIFNRVQA